MFYTCYTFKHIFIKTLFWLELYEILFLFNFIYSDIFCKMLLFIYRFSSILTTYTHARRFHFRRTNVRITTEKREYSDGPKTLPASNVFMDESVIVHQQKEKKLAQEKRHKNNSFPSTLPLASLTAEYIVKEKLIFKLLKKLKNGGYSEGRYYK